MTVGEYIGLYGYCFTRDTLDRKPAAIDFRRNTFDYDAPPALGRAFRRLPHVASSLCWDESPKSPNINGCSSASPVSQFPLYERLQARETESSPGTVLSPAKAKALLKRGEFSRVDLGVDLFQ